MKTAAEHTLERLPLTMRPALATELAERPLLFPFEQQRLDRLLAAVDALPATELDRLTAPVRQIEQQMEIHRWQFSTNADSMLNASQLLRSPYYSDWRRAIRQLTDALEQQADRLAPRPPAAPTTLVLVLPADLPVNGATLDRLWQRHAHRVDLSATARPFSAELIDALAPLSAEPSACWSIDAAGQTALPAPSLQLNYAALHDFTARFLAAVNAVPKSIATSDQILAEVRQRDWQPDWPVAQLGTDPRLLRFVVDLYLSGNGALIFSNSFVQWAAAEALRRARPQRMLARFGVRPRPKPFTGIAIFEDQHQISRLPDVPDPEGSAIDAQQLAHYVWLAARRYPEYERLRTVCIAEHLRQAWLFGDAPTPAVPLAPGPLAAWLAAG